MARDKNGQEKKIKRRRKRKARAGIIFNAVYRNLRITVADVSSDESEPEERQAPEASIDQDSKEDVEMV